MCGRYVLAVSPELLQQAFDLTMVPDFAPRYNIAPTQYLPVITDEARHDVQLLRWGLIPSWAKDAKMASNLINARSDGVAEKPSFRTAFRRRRCLIPATGYYEWHTGDNGKVPIYIHLSDQPVFAMAGLWEVWLNPETGELVRTYSLITTDANEYIQAIHTRMPVILQPKDYDVWLDGETVPAPVLQGLLVPYEGAMAAYEVSKAVNRPINDSAELIIPFAS